MKRFAIALVIMLSWPALAQEPSKNTATMNGSMATSTKQEKVQPITKLHGWVVDEVCGRVTGRTSEHASCARMCSRMDHRQLVFVSDYNGVNIAVKNPNELRPFMGKHLDIEARLIAPKTIEVVRVDPASVNASPNDPIAAHDVLILPQSTTVRPSGTEQEKKAK